MDGMLAFHDTAPDVEDFRDAVLAGLSRPRKSIPCKFFYDERGSALFEEICDLPEYYPTRTEIAILEDAVPEIADLAGPAAALIEFGSGSSRKVRILLDALRAPAAYVPVDISREHLRRSAADLAADFPALDVVAVCADYTRPFRLPPLAASTRRRVGFYPGSTIGNFTPDDAGAFLRTAARLLGRGAGMVIGVDLRKDRETLEAAYDDRRGVTAAFNLNLLARVNRELDGDFDLDRFAHEAVWDAEEGCVTMYLRSLADQTVTVAGRRYRFAAGERVHTENSYKYSLDGFRRLAAHAGFRAVETWTDRDDLFSVYYLDVV
ncbi:MAG TPA: L-histidine N(alpha)-methyltransferase [Stellaceae bacterium]